MLPKQVGAHCIETCHINLYQIGNNNPLETRQYDSSLLLCKNGGNVQSRTAIQVNKEISDYVLANRIAVTTEYLPSSLNGNLEITKSQTIGI